MTYVEFIRNLGKAGITAKEFAILLKKNPNSITNNASRGKVPNELGIIAVLIGEMADNKLEYKELIKAMKLSSQKVRGGAEIGKFGGNPQQSLLKKLK
ncbi:MULTISPECIES: XRE family transcriptional regulator [unclassified Pseudoalteromonas]|uniref:XRE family transcriptional regulator n=1 Tax=Pseudoalteromonas TaxID=53246 RepID=UPI0025B57526|nr:MULTISPECIES: XRE family transcriptional regulator [unclassified Pseudoalteromonas]MDN3431465.1 XRE family transcriptional regulator [Pseudoalteromonas sp. APC 3907]MDN3433834.1 XRE family transcriptional regulator [Pseudoalteromonas sp. APC 3356]MDN3463827.1 XRE family transcriptional regulator [Pseudoalteromonas sp. APC 3495]